MVLPSMVQHSSGNGIGGGGGSGGGGGNNAGISASRWRYRVMVWASVMASAVLVWRLWVLVSAPYPLPSRPEPLPVSLSIIGEGSDRDWMPVLKHGAIYKIIHHNPYGLSEKFKVVFENGMSASVKVIEPFSLWPKEFDVIDAHTVNTTVLNRVRRAWAIEQGWNELAAFYVDRALDWYLKPPTAGRFITNKELYAHDDRFWSVLKRMLPTYRIPVTLIAWLDGMRMLPPSLDVQDMMTQHKPLPSNDTKLTEMLSQVSDVLVFDYLLDDHDRIEEHNWYKDRRGRYITWDSGLAFRHGPFGRESYDQDIWCGRKGWVANRLPDATGRGCRRICMFRNDTINQLLAFMNPDPSGLTKRLRQLIRDDLLAPVFNYNIYHTYLPRFVKVRYRNEDFYYGIEKRLREIIKYARRCAKEFGPERVYL